MSGATIKPCQAWEGTGCCCCVLCISFARKIFPPTCVLMKSVGPLFSKPPLPASISFLPTCCPLGQQQVYTSALCACSRILAQSPGIVPKSSGSAL